MASDHSRRRSVARDGRSKRKTESVVHVREVGSDAEVDEPETRPRHHRSDVKSTHKEGTTVSRSHTSRHATESVRKVRIKSPSPHRHVSHRRSGERSEASRSRHAPSHQNHSDRPRGRSHLRDEAERKSPPRRSSILGSFLRSPPPRQRDGPPVSYKTPKIERSTSVSSKRSQRAPSVVGRSTPVATTRTRRPASVAPSTRSTSKVRSKPEAKPKEPEPELECLTCADSLPASQVAQLPCNHNMCNACLKRVFELSVTDPQHMPPKCCTSKSIPLKHVDKIFDQKFKSKWNQKQLEYSTKNRIYCPARGCGTWIKPADIKTDSAGRKSGKCSRCKTKVCAKCNGKWHVSRTCPDDPETKEFVKLAKERGWQRCYNCQATVQLKEGCNHITCRCTAQFCMICGSKWKTCDCRWFNFGQAPDRLNDMQIPEFRHVPAHPGQDPEVGYQEFVDRRRAQERLDEALARRVQFMAFNDVDIDEHGAAANGEEGFGNAADHFLNHDFHVNFAQRAQDLLAARADVDNAQAAERLIQEHRRGHMRHERVRDPRLPHGPLNAIPNFPPIHRNAATAAAAANAVEARVQAARRDRERQRREQDTDIPAPWRGEPRRENGRNNGPDIPPFNFPPVGGLRESRAARASVLAGLARENRELRDGGREGAATNGGDAGQGRGRVDAWRTWVVDPL